jgi:hypothetical protein
MSKLQKYRKKLTSVTSGDLVFDLTEKNDRSTPDLIFDELSFAV